MKKIRTYLLMLGFAGILLMPGWLQKLGTRFQLSGVSSTTEFPVLTRQGILDGTVQDALDTYYTEHLPGRDVMIKLRNQMIVSLYAKSPNQNIVIGKNRDLFEEEYILKYEKVYPPATEEYVRDLCEKLTVIRDRLEEKGKELYLFITPTKVRYYEEDVPALYRAAASFTDRPGNYEVFTEVLKQYDFKVYDSIPYVNQLAEQADYPLYYKTGSHWSWMLSTEVTVDFVRFLNANSRYQFPEAEMTYEPAASVLHPDADIFNSLNVITPPYDEYYQAHLISEPRSDEGPNLFCRGGSFMGQTIASLISNGYFHQDTYIENTMVSHNRLSEIQYFSDYSELDLKTEIGRADIVILEVNESHIPVMSFGLIDYLTEHPDILD